MNNGAIQISIPSKPDYISLVRLTASSVAHKLGLNIDEIEDIKVAIGEACINSLSLSKEEKITIEFLEDDDKLEIKVSNVKKDIPDDLAESKERMLGILIIESLMDKVVFTDSDITMIKYFE